MTIRTKFKDGTFIPLENVKEGKEGELVEIEIKPVEGSRFFAVQPEASRLIVESGEFKMEKGKELIEKYKGYILDPEGNAVEIMEMLFVREKIQDFLESPDQITIIPPELHRTVMELDDQLWHNIDTFLK